jgi:carboxyl-terminal processing protease
MMRSIRGTAYSRTVLVFVSLALLLPIISSTLTLALAEGEGEGDDSFYKHLSVFTEVLSLIRRGYVDETSIDELFEGALDGTMDALDPLATYVPASKVEEYREVLARGPRSSGLMLARDRGITYVLSVLPRSPAETSGLEKGDVLAEVDGRSTRQMPLWEIETLLAEESGAVTLKLLRRMEFSEVTLELQEFEIEPAKVLVERGVPILRISYFEPGLPSILETLLEDSAVVGSDDLLIDLRGAAGGSHEAAYSAAGLFVQGLLGELRNRTESIEKFESERSPAWEGDIVILTDRSSQGPSEVLVAVLRQAADASLVGERTFGHAGRRVARSLSNGASVFLSDAFYTGPDGVGLDESIVPEVLVDDSSRTPSEADVALKDIALERAVELILERQRASKKAAA